MTDSESASKPETSGQSNSSEDDPGLDESEYLPEEASRPRMNRAQRRGAQRKRPLQDAAKSVDSQKAMGGLAELLKGKGPQYVPVTKSLEAIGLVPSIEMVSVGGADPVQCMVIPVQELVFKEWQHMTKSNYGIVAVEENKDGE